MQCFLGIFIHHRCTCCRSGYRRSGGSGRRSSERLQTREEGHVPLQTQPAVHPGCSRWTHRRLKSSSRHPHVSGTTRELTGSRWGGKAANTRVERILLQRVSFDPRRPILCDHAVFPIPVKPFDGVTISCDGD